VSCVSRATGFIRFCATGLPGEYRFYREGLVSLYASCYAAMARHFVGDLDSLMPVERSAWCDYINSWQDPETGCYLGPELAPDELTRPEMDEAYVRLHLAAHVLPALDVLSGAPAHPLRFAQRFADLAYLRTWLEARDWRQAWQEGNNLLFAGQLLVYLRDREQHPAAQQALNLYFDWLDAQQDPATGLWGTNGYCDPYDALYGGYHPLLVYCFCGRPVRHAERIIDVVLSLQQSDGSFGRTPGGGACEDVDAVHVLVNLVQRTGHRLADARLALRLTLRHLLRQQAPEGGFVYRWGCSYMQSGLLRTYVPADRADLFSTWFRLHTLAVTSQVLDEPELREVDWRFNPTCSMGWQGAPSALSRVAAASVQRMKPAARQKGMRHPIRQAAGRIIGAAIARIPAGRAAAFAAVLLRVYGQGLAPGDRLDFLTNMDAVLDRMGEETARELGGGLDVQFWGTQSYRVLWQYLWPGMQLLHLGCGTGSLSFSIASSASVHVVATDRSHRLVEAAKARYRHPHLSFAAASEILPWTIRPDLVLCTDLVEGKPAWDAWKDVWALYGNGVVLAQLTPYPASWREAALRFRSSAALTAENSPELIPPGWEVLDIDGRAAALHARLRVSSSE
jgi:hypothetical protein